MSKLTAAVISSNKQELNDSASLLENGVSEELGMNLNVKKYESRQRISKPLRECQLYIATSLNPNSSQQRIARDLNKQNALCARILLTGAEDVIAQHKLYGKASLLSSYVPFLDNSNVEITGIGDINWNHLQNWVRRDYTTFDDIIIAMPHEDKKAIKQRTKKSIQYVRGNKKMSQLLDVGISGLGSMGMGILERAAKEPKISNIYANTGFVKGEYNALLDSLDLTGEQRAKIKTGSLDLLFEANPDIFIVSTGEHDFDYNQCENRQELTTDLLKENIPRVAPKIKKALKAEYPGLIVIETNPTSHLIKYARNLGIPSNQITSFTPDTIRHTAELYNEIRKKHPDIKEEDIRLIAVGEHMKGGTPVFSKCLVNGKPLSEAYPEFKNKKMQDKICKAAQEKGLRVMRSAEKFHHDYRGVPERVKECLEDIIHLQEYSRYPIYTGPCLSLPARFTYKGRGSRNESHIRVQRDKRNSSLIQDKEILGELKQDIKNLREDITPYCSYQKS